MGSEALMKFLRQALRKRIVLALVVGGVVFATAYAFAATLAVTSKSLGAGNTTVTACTSNTLQASYALTFQGGTGNTIGTGGSAWTYNSVAYGNIVSGATGAPWVAGQYYVSTITVTPIDGTQSLSTCASKLLTLDVLGASNADLAQYTVTLPATPGTSWTFGVAASGGTGVGQAIPVANAVPASVVQGIAIAISG
jgi:hypothetical protein